MGIVIDHHFSDDIPPASKRRRQLLTAGVALLASPLASLSHATVADGAPRRLAFRHTHTGESLSIVYATDDRYVPSAIERINWLLRDFRSGESHPIDPTLLDQLHQLAELTRSSAPYEVISGYRSAATNEYLQRRGGVATHSLHMEGRAIDVRLADVKLADLRDAAKSLGAGGVGFYPKSQFVHLDTGGVRYW